MTGCHYGVTCYSPTTNVGWFVGASPLSSATRAGPLTSCDSQQRAPYCPHSQQPKLQCAPSRINHFKNAIIPPLILPRILWPRRYTYTPGYTPSPGCRAHLRFRSPVGGQKLGCFLVRHIRGNAKALKCMWSYARGDAGAAANADAKEVSNPQPDANAPLLDLRRMQRTLSSRPPSSTRLRFRCYAKRARRALYWSSRTNAAKILRR